MKVSAAEFGEVLKRSHQRFVRWKEQSLLSDNQLDQITAHYRVWWEDLDPSKDYAHWLSHDTCQDMVGLQEGADCQELAFLAAQVRQHAAADRLTSGVAATCLREVEQQMAALGVAKPEQGPPQRSFVEMLLDPRSLQMLMACGGGLLVLGLVIWLALIGVFDEPKVVASIMGSANIAMLAVGAGMVRRTQHTMAGRGITLLACLVLPLNLWFYNAQGLIRLEDGGHLWIPALVICCLYATAARLLKDATFVYTLVAGVTMTGLLFLADQQVQRLWEVVSPAALMIGVGVACIHAERLFAPGEGPFSRQSFGLAFFRAGHVALMAGLSVLMGGRLVGRFYEEIFESLDLYAIPDVAVVAKAQLVALGLIALASYTYAYSQVVVDRSGRYAYLAISTLVWCEIIALDVFGVQVTEQLLVVMLTSAAITSNATSALATKLASKKALPHQKQPRHTLADGLGVCGEVFLWLAVGLGGWQATRCLLGFEGLLSFTFSPFYALAMSGVGLTAFAAAWQHVAQKRHRLFGSVLHVGILATLLAAFGGLQLLGLESLEARLPVLMLLPLATLAISRGQLETPLGRNLRSAAQVQAVLLTGVAVMAVVGLGPAPAAAFEPYAELLLGVAFAQAAALFGWVARYGKKATLAPALAAVSGCAAVWQWLCFVDFTTYAPLLAISVVGVGCLAVARMAKPATNQDGEPTSTTNLAAVGTGLVHLGGAGGVLLAINRLLAGEAAGMLAALLIGQCLAGVIGAMLSSKGAQRGLFIVAAASLAAALATINALSLLSAMQRMELLITGVGGAMLGCCSPRLASGVRPDQARDYLQPSVRQPTVRHALHSGSAG